MINPDRLVELSVDPTARAAEREGIDREELRAWRAAVDAIRAGVEEGTPTTAPRRLRSVQERVLRATTRGQPGWQGELALLGRFFLHRCRESRLVRVVAASLLVHLAALPVLAWYAFHRPEPEPTVHVSPPVPEEFPARAREPLAESPPIDTLEFLDPESVGTPERGAAENARRRSRFLLQRAAADPPLDAGAATDVGRALAARRAGWSGDRSALERVRAGRTGLSRAARAVLVEALLDRALLAGEDDGLRAALAELRPWDDAQGAGALERSVAARASAYGWTDPDLRARWRTADWLHPEASPLGDPFPPGRAELLRSVADPADPVVARWIGWLER